MNRVLKGMLKRQGNEIPITINLISFERVKPLLNSPPSGMMTDCGSACALLPTRKCLENQLIS
jgi:hypothetical protein